MTQQDVAGMVKYCVVCGKELEPSTNAHCTSTSLVAMRKERAGIFSKHPVFFTLDGRELNKDALSRMRDTEIPRARRAEAEQSKTYYCRVCGKKNATEHEVGPMTYYVCSKNCATILYNSVVAKAMSGYGSVFVAGDASHHSSQTSKYASVASCCNWCGSNIGTETVMECASCGGVQLIGLRR
jgi:hypothetical protein